MDMSSDKPMDVRAFLARPAETGWELVHESELVNHLDELDTYLDVSIVPPSEVLLEYGAISVRYGGRELLGKVGRVDRMNLASGPNVRRDGGGPIVRPLGDGVEYRVTHVSDETINFALLDNGDVRHAVDLPASRFRLEWQFMTMRIWRLMAFLGDTNEQKGIEADLKRAGGIDNLYTYTLSAPLDVLLADPVPTRYL